MLPPWCVWLSMVNLSLELSTNHSKMVALHGPGQEHNSSQGQLYTAQLKKMGLKGARTPLKVNQGVRIGCLLLIDPKKSFD